MSTISSIGFILSIILIFISAKKHNKYLIYLGCISLIICGIYVVPEFFKGFMDGVTSVPS